MKQFTHLHLHTHYSLLDGMSRMPELMDRAKELGFSAIGLTDHGVLYGAIEFYEEARKRGIKPILGCEVYMATRSRFDREPKLDDRQYHLTLLAKTTKATRISSSWRRRRSWKASTTSRGQTTNCWSNITRVSFAFRVVRRARFRGRSGMGTRRRRGNWRSAIAICLARIASTSKSKTTAWTGSRRLPGSL